jgi:hypothetical protein
VQPSGCDVSGLVKLVNKGLSYLGRAVRRTAFVNNPLDPPYHAALSFVIRVGTLSTTLAA